MRHSYVLGFLVAVFSVPAVAADVDQDLKQEVERIATAYAQSFNKHDGAGIAALYAKDGMHINPAGPRTDIALFYEGAFKAGFSHEEITVDRVWPLGADVLLATGEFHLTGINASGAPIELEGLWTSTDVREGGAWKIRMLSAFPKAPTPKR